MLQLGKDNFAHMLAIVLQINNALTIKTMEHKTLITLLDQSKSHIITPC